MPASLTVAQAVVPGLELVHDVDDVMRLLRCSRSHVNKLLREERLHAVKSGRKVLITAEELRRYLASLPRAQFKTSPANRLAA